MEYLFFLRPERGISAFLNGKTLDNGEIVKFSIFSMFPQKRR